MIYDGHNAQGAEVYDIEAKKKLEHAYEVNTETGEVQAWHWPLRLSADRETVEHYTLRFTTIYPIFGGRTDPVLFHCYGRIE